MSNINQTSTKRPRWKRAVALATALHILSYTMLPSVGMVAAEQVAQKEVKASTNSATSSAKSTEAAKNMGASLKTKLNLDVSSAIIVEASTGQVYAEYEADTALPPASMTKMMTEYIVMEKIKAGELAWDTVVTTSEHASLTEGSRIFLAKGDMHTVEELYIAMAIGSANDATVALAEHISQSEKQFVKLMNETAKRLGMEDTHFINSTGLGKADMPKKYQPASDEETVMSARDVAKLVRAIVVDHPEFSKYTTIQQHKFRDRDATPIINLNWMLEANKNVTNFRQFAYEGLDGMKTGFTDAAKYTFAGTAERDGMRLITVVMGAPTKAARFTETKKLLDHGFKHIELKQVIGPKQVVAGTETAPIKSGVETEVPIVTEQEVAFVVDKGAKFDAKNLKQEVKLTPEDQLEAPIKQGQKIGTVTYTYKGTAGEEQQTVNLIASEEVEKGSWWRLFFRGIKNFFVDLFNSIGSLF
ncbi:D-alanyl-D-alanine carboxypeptidase family protein [Paenibacillus assamensis]|uniref:D-alanyl-D-alanine carboxypeptidase family protein n=1 Tax=Paenibacillus assamensis TaxID=311244 RepID=UPI0004141332|nr:D-alanyl-D-alanine carboxypeptidase family protein [Paenibacillus assamensis]